MDINFFGQACFKLKGKTAAVVIDPFNAAFTGLKLPPLEADITLISHDHKDHNNAALVSGSTIFTGPGEYEVKGVTVSGIASFHDNQQGAQRGKNTIYHLLIDNINIVHLGDLGQDYLTEEQLTQINTTDIVLLPVGGVYTISAKEAANIVSQLEPKIIIPMHYLLPGLKFELEPLDKFLKEMGAEGVSAQPKLSVTQEKLPEEPTVVVLSKG